MKPFFALLLLLAAGGCRQDRGTVLAKVGDAVLTREDVVAAIDTTRAPAGQQIRAYVISWVNNELLHQEAARRGIDKSENVERQLTDVKRQLAVQGLLDEEDRADTAGADSAALRFYFDAHAQEFLLREDMVRLNIIVLARREEASTFAAAVSAGTSWAAASEKLAADTAAAQTIRFASAGAYYSRRTLAPPDLWKVAGTLGAGEVSFPVRIGDGFAVLQLLTRLAEGTSAEFDVVRDEVAQRVMMERRRARYDALLAKLRASTSIQVMLSPASATDTTQLLPHE